MNIISLLNKDVNKYDKYIKEHKVNSCNHNETENVQKYPTEGGEKKTILQGYSGKIYNLLLDTGIQFNGRFYGPTIKTDKIVETGLYLEAYSRSNTITFNIDGIAEVDGNQLIENCAFYLIDGSFVILKDEELCIVTAKGYTITQKVMPDRSIKLEIKKEAFGISDNNLSPGGFIGLTLNTFFMPELCTEEEIEMYLKIFEVISILPPIIWKIKPAA